MKKETLTVETDENGTITYRNADGKLHNAHEPAVIYPDGDKAYYLNGHLHNENGPAIIRLDGGKSYCINGEFHNPHGPAIVYPDGHEAYYINNNMLTEADFKAWQTQQSAPLHNKTAVIDGIEYTLMAK